MTQPDWAVKKVAAAPYAGNDDWGVAIISQESAIKLLRAERRRCVRAVKRVKRQYQWMEWEDACDECLAAMEGKR